MDEFETAAKPLCDKIGNENNTNINLTYYYGAWVKTKMNKYKDMFIGCCKICEKLSTIEWIIKLKNQLIKLSKFGLLRKDTIVWQSNMHLLINTYFLTSDLYNNDKISACESITYDLIPVSLGNYVGFAGALDRLSSDRLLSRVRAPIREKNVAYVGQYTSAIANKYTKNHCLNTVTLTPYSVCVIHMSMKKYYGYQCCCYGDKIPLCQERIRTAIVTGLTDKAFRRSKIACVIDKDRLKGSSEVNFQTDGIEYKGDVHNLMDAMQQSFCELHLTFNGVKQINISFNSNFKFKHLALLYQETAKTIELATISDLSNSGLKPYIIPYNPNLSSISMDELQKTAINQYNKLIEQSVYVTVSLKCLNLSNWDPRAHDISTFHCVQLLPLDAQCPFNSAKSFLNQHIMCCCNHQSFCNYNTDIIKRAAIKSIPNLCKYNNEYQYLLHDYFYPAKSDAGHSCLLHFVSRNALRDMNQLFPLNDSVIFLLPGSAIQPIDFSYALLKPNQCDYIDVDLKYDYLHARYCYEKTNLLKYFETKYMPMRLFACRCQTVPGAEPCDALLEKTIAKKAKNPKRKYLCAKYSGQKSLAFNQRPKFILNDLSPYCLTILHFRIINNKIYYTFSGNIARRNLINKAKLQLAIIPYTMYSMSGDRTQLCMQLMMRMIICVCRNNYYERKPCNLNPYEKSKTLQLAIYEMNKYRVILKCNAFVFYKIPERSSKFEHLLERDKKLNLSASHVKQTREIFPNELLQYTTIKEPKWCHSESIFSTITINYEKKEINVISDCVKKTLGFNENKIKDLVCAEKLFDEECGIISQSGMITNDGNEERIVCCCIDYCDLIGLQLHQFNINAQLLMEQ